jgi:hypothetical protein
VAALLVEAVDPCLPCSLTVADEAPAKETPHVHRLRL